MVYTIKFTGWATATGDIDYSVKLVFSDDEDSAPSTTTASSAGPQSKTAATNASSTGRCHDAEMFTPNSSC